MRDDVMEAGAAWMASKRYTNDPAVLSKIVKRVEYLLETFGGYVSQSHFERAYLELCAEKEIQPFRTKFEDTQQPTVPPDVVAYIERTSAFELQRRYKSDREFARLYDLWQKNPKQAAVASGPLSVEQYYAMPARELQVKLRSPEFKLQVMQLIKAGKI